LIEFLKMPRAGFKRDDDVPVRKFRLVIIEPIASPVGSANLSRNSTARRNFNGEVAPLIDVGRNRTILDGVRSMVTENRPQHSPRAVLF